MKLLGDLYESLAGWINFEGWLGVPAGFDNGFAAGAATLLALALVVWLVSFRAARREKCRELTIEGEHGNMFITISAVREFVRRILDDFNEASLEGVKLRQRKNNLNLNIEVVVLPQTDLVPLRDALQERLMSEAQKKLGISRPFKVDVTVKSLEASERKTQRRQGHKLPQTPEPAAEDYPEDTP